MKKQSQNETDIAGLIAGLQEQLASLEKKVDILIGRSLLRPVETPSSHQPVYAHDPIPGAGRQNDHHKTRQMYPATCSDCKKACELPFKPSGDRPVYCKECFSRRKSSNTLKAAADHKSKETPPAPLAMNIQASVVKEKKKLALAKKAVAKKKPAAQKKKKAGK